MSSSSNYDLGDTPIIRGRDVVYDNVRCNNADLETINNDPYPPGGGFLPVPVANKVLRTNGLAVVSWGDVGVNNLTGGSANQIMHTKSDASGVEWTSNLTVPGNLVVNLASTFTGNGLFENDCSVENDLNVVNGDMVVANGDLNVLLGNTVVNNLECSGNLSFNASSGSVSDIVVKTGASTQGWGKASAGSITPGSANQILVTNSGGTATTWSSNVVVPGTLGVNGVATTSGTLNVASDLQIAGSSGSSGNFVKKTGANTQSWSNLAESDVKGGVVNQFLQSDGTNGVWNSNITCPGSVLVNGTATMAGVTNLNGNLQFAAVSGSIGNFLKKTGATSQAWKDLAASDVKGGTLNQVFQSNGTNGVWNTDVTLPGNLDMSSGTAIASFLETRQIGALKLGGNFAGSLGAVCVSDASSVPHWEFPQYYVEYYQNVAVDMNGGGAVLLMAAASANVSNAGITYSAGVFTCSPGIYEAIFTTRPTVASGGKTQVNFRVNGSFAGSTVSLGSVTEAQQINLRRTFRFNASSTIEVVSEILVAGAVKTSGADSNGIATTLLTIQRIGAYV